jgi:hypothetical protein
MMRRVVQDAGYTAVGLGVLGLQQVQIRGRQLVKTVKIATAPVTGLLANLPRIPGPVGTVVDEGRARLVQALRPAR